MSLYGLHHRCLNSAAAGLVRLEYSIYASTRSVCATPRERLSPRTVLPPHTRIHGDDHYFYGR